VTVLARSSSKSDFPSSVTVKLVDYNSIQSLTAALNGQDAVVSAVGVPGQQGQNLIIDAAVAARVKRFIPSDFGADIDNPKTKALPVFGYKVATQNYVEDVARANPSFTYTIIRNGVFLDWGLETGFLFDWQAGRPIIYDGGNQLFSTTTLATVGLAVVGVLSNTEETKNRAVFIQDMQTSQNKILAIAKKIAPEKDWTPVYASTETIKKDSDAKIAKGDYSMPVMFGYLFSSVFGDGYGARIEKTENELLGLPGNKTEADIEIILKPLLAGEKHI
jgi:hypothetical protein